MEKTVRLNADQREDLVAYLDGELPDDQVRQIDTIVSRSEVARHEVEVLARTWEMLDVLPSAKASNDFASRTMTNLKALEAPYVFANQWWYAPLKRTISIAAWLAALLICGWIGFEVAKNRIPNPHEELLQDLPLIENLDSYQEARELDFIIQLKQNGLFDDAQGK